MCFTGGRVEDVDAAAIGADPDLAAVVFDDGVDEFGEGIGGIVYETIFCTVITVDAAAPGGDPEVSFPVFGECRYKVVAEAFGVAGVVLEDGEFVAIVAVEAVAGAEPHEAAAILEDAGDIALGKA